MHRGRCGQSTPAGVGGMGGVALGWLLQYWARARWFSLLWGPPQIGHRRAWALHADSGCPHFQQRWQRGTPTEALASWMRRTMLLKWRVRPESALALVPC